MQNVHGWRLSPPPTTRSYYCTLVTPVVLLQNINCSDAHKLATPESLDAWTRGDQHSGGRLNDVNETDTRYEHTAVAIVSRFHPIPPLPPPPPDCFSKKKYLVLEEKHLFLDENDPLARQKTPRLSVKTPRSRRKTPTYISKKKCLTYISKKTPITGTCFFPTQTVHFRRKVKTVDGTSSPCLIMSIFIRPRLRDRRCRRQTTSGP